MAGEKDTGSMTKRVPPSDESPLLKEDNYTFSQMIKDVVGKSLLYLFAGFGFFISLSLSCLWSNGEMKH